MRPERHRGLRDAARCRGKPMTRLSRPARLRGVCGAALLLLAAALSGPVRAQDDAAAGAEDLDWYRVEVIVFRQPPLAGEPLEAPPLRVRPPAGSPLQALRTGADGKTPYARLERDRLALGDIAGRLARRPGFEVLWHAGWEQPGLGRTDAPYVPLPPAVALAARDSDPGATAAEDDARPDPFAVLPPDARLFGTLRLYRERYLHFETDLRYRLDEAPSESARLGEALALDSPFDPATHVMTVSRRMRSEELHYLDHPVLGVIVRAVPIEE